MLYVSSKQHLQSDSESIIQLGQTGQGKWHQMAKGGSAALFTKEGSNYHQALCPTDDLASRLREMLAAASKCSFLGPHTHL